MFTTFHSRASKRRRRQQQGRNHRVAKLRTLQAEPLEPRMMLSADSWVVPLGLSGGLGVPRLFPGGIL